MAAVPFKLYSQKELAYIDNIINTKIKRWLTETFGLTVTEIEGVENFFCCSGNQKSGWDESDCDGHTIVVKGKYARVKLTYCDTLLEPFLGESSDIAKDEFCCFLTILIRRLLDDLAATHDRLLEFDALPRAHVKGSGVLYKKWTSPGMLAEVMVVGQLLLPEVEATDKTREFEKHRQPLISRSEAVKSDKIKLRATLGVTEVSIGDLHSLAVGDIIKLDKLFAESVDLINGAGNLVCKGKLGEKGRCRAVMVTKQ